MSPERPESPGSGLSALSRHWRQDLLSAFTVALVALPLGLGIASACNVSPMSGVFSAIVGGLAVTFLRGSHIAINGPTAGLIGVTLHAEQTLADPGGNGFRYVLAVFVCAGAFQVVLGLLKLGRLGKIFPAFVVRGMLSAIGVIIFATQAHVALGLEKPDGSALRALFLLPEALARLNPYATLIAALSLCVLVVHPKINSKLVRFVPAPMWVMFVALPLMFLLGFNGPEREESLFGYAFPVGEGLLLDMPGSLAESMLLPDFGKAHLPAFWFSALAVALIASLETLLAASAIDKLDDFRRRSELNRELVAIGVGTVLSACIGGLPVATVIIRSSVNVNNGAHTRWSNFLHGALLLAFVGLLGLYLSLVPQAALAAILVFTGYRLASPKLFQDALRKGWEQLAILLATLLATLAVNNLLAGMAVGTVFALLVQWSQTRLSFRRFFVMMRRARLEVVEEEAGARHALTARGAINFLMSLRLTKALESLPRRSEVVLDFGSATVVDHTVLESVYEFAYAYEADGGRCSVNGLDVHRASSSHPHALHFFRKPVERLTPRQRELKRFAERNGWRYYPDVDWRVSALQGFAFFRHRPVEYRNNVVTGAYPDGSRWKLSDLTFDEGAFVAAEIRRTTAQVIALPFPTPAFALEREELLDRLLDYAFGRDVELNGAPEFSKRFALHAEDPDNVRRLFTPSLIAFLGAEAETYHIECDGERLLVFKKMRLASPTEAERLVDFGQRLLPHLHPVEDLA